MEVDESNGNDLHSFEFIAEISHLLVILIRST